MTWPSGIAAAAGTTTETYRHPRPSLHLAWSELACHDETRTPYPVVWEDRAVSLAAEFELVRTACGDVPLYILSAYRTPEWNRRCGGVSLSQHLQGRALDVHLRPGWTEERMFKAIRDVALRQNHGERVGKIRGIGRYPGKFFFHFDIRPQDQLVIWEGKHVHYVPCE